MSTPRASNSLPSMVKVKVKVKTSAMKRVESYKEKRSPLSSRK